MQRRLAKLIATLTFGAMGLGASACVIRESPGVNRGYGYGYASAGYQGGVAVGTPSPYYVSSLPPEPLYETMSTSPGYGYVWIDGYWHWNGYEWVWVTGRWTREQTGYIYVQPYYDWGDDGRYVYYPGYWSRPERVPERVRVIDHRDGRPSTGYHPPRPTHERPPVRDHRGEGVRPPRPVRDPVGPGIDDGPRDHRDPDRPVSRPPRRPDVDDRPGDNARPPRDNPPPAPRPPRKPTVDDRPSDNARPPRDNPPPAARPPSKPPQNDRPSDNARPPRDNPPPTARPPSKPPQNNRPSDNARPPRDNKPTARPPSKPPKSDSGSSSKPGKNRDHRR